MTDITSPLVTHLEEESDPYPNLKDVEVYVLKGGDYPLERTARNACTWQELDALAEQEQKTLYVFRQKDNRLIKIVKPPVGGPVATDADKTTI